MKAFMYSVRDVKSEIFTKPMIFQNDETAKRGFMVAVTTEGDPMSSFPDDYVLYKVGHWDDENGLCQGRDPERICTGLEMVVYRSKQVEQIEDLHLQIKKLNGEDNAE